jgi:hypothetical protein
VITGAPASTAIRSSCKSCIAVLSILSTDSPRSDVIVIA